MVKLSITDSCFQYLNSFIHFFQFCERFLFSGRDKKKKEKEKSPFSSNYAVFVTCKNLYSNCKRATIIFHDYLQV